ncbi:helix-turn-helix domain-containing protein [Tsukamurella sp. 1534]|uniref:winged helix-turn-helix transcriptional regulator n=1 Tax=Tsukamurella sp. 1534 TaxID=1151061 RepID=UPI00030A0E89|nr:helix-turn-helix domain-containing protein [Tsukamurella sp. 1534]
MALGTGYDAQGCFLARALEVVGERWTLLILRDCFYGVRHFSDLLAHLDVSRGVLTDRLDTLVDAGVLERHPAGRSVEYLLTEAGEDLWPTVFSLSRWGERHLTADHPGRIFGHAVCGTDIEDSGLCPRCGTVPTVRELDVRPAPGRNARRREDPVAIALRTRHRMLDPLP